MRVEELTSSLAGEGRTNILCCFLGQVPCGLNIFEQTFLRSSHRTVFSIRQFTRALGKNQDTIHGEISAFDRLASVSSSIDRVVSNRFDMNSTDFSNNIPVPMLSKMEIQTIP